MWLLFRRLCKYMLLLCYRMCELGHNLYKYTGELSIVAVNDLRSHFVVIEVYVTLTPFPPPHTFCSDWG